MMNKSQVDWYSVRIIGVNKKRRIVMRKNILVHYLMFIFIVFFLSPSVFAENAEDAQFLDVKTGDITYITVNHKQGGIGFVIQDVNYFYYIKANEDWQKIFSSSALLKDIKNASKIKIKHIPYGLHREIVNLLLFYGEDGVSQNLKLNIDSENAPE